MMPFFLSRWIVSLGIASMSPFANFENVLIIVSERIHEVLLSTGFTVPRDER